MKIVGKILCFFGLHNLYVRRRFSDSVRQVGCSRCSKLWGMNDRVKSFIPWDEDLEELHNVK